MSECAQRACQGKACFDLHRQKPAGDWPWGPPRVLPGPPEAGEVTTQASCEEPRRTSLCSGPELPQLGKMAARAASERWQMAVILSSTHLVRRR